MKRTPTMFGEEAEILRRLIKPDAKLPQAAARALLSLDFDEEDRERMHELSQKNQVDALTPTEEVELQSYLKVGLFLDLLHAKATHSLRKR
jgi:hypothetical protein